MITFGKSIDSLYLFTPSEGSSQGRAHGRVALHPACESDSCFQGLFQWEEKHTEEVHVSAVSASHLKTPWLAWRH